MPRNEQVVVVLVASPSDLEPERNQLEDVVRELNLVWSRSFSLRLELVRWETHGYPGMGLDPQDVLNRELPDEPDIFIGLMWSRYGTETGRAGSGTEEEFRWALERYKQDPKSVRIMFYFKDAPLVPSAIDPDQLSRVQEFRASLGSEGSLYFQFGTPEEFERLLRIHLSRQIQEFAATNSSEQKAVSPIPALANSLGPETESEEEAESAELGLIDFLDSVDEHFHALNEIAGRIAKEITLLGENMRGRTQEVNAATADAPQGQLGRREARGLIEKAAGDMTQFVAKMKTEIPLFKESLQKGATAAARAALINANLNSSNRTHADTVRNGLVKFRNGLASAYEATKSFKGVVQGLPRMTAVLNKAKRDTAMVLQDLLDSMAEGRRIVTETIKSLDTRIG